MGSIPGLFGCEVDFQSTDLSSNPNGFCSSARSAWAVALMANAQAEQRLECGGLAAGAAEQQA